MNAHEEEVDRILLPLIGYLREGNWSALWQAFGITDRPFQQMMQDGNDPLAVAAAIDGSLRPTRYVDPALIRCPATYYAGSEDWIVPHVRTDVEALDATLDIIDGQGHLGSFFSSSEPVLAAVGARLRH
jgi:pimeloyl-ACP methyl ester carboxylesterase